MSVSGDQVDCLIAARGAEDFRIQSYQTSLFNTWDGIKHFNFSLDGCFIAICDQIGIKVYSTKNLGKEIVGVEKSGVIEMKISPKNNFLSFWEPVKGSQNNVPNLHIFDLKNKKIVLEVVHRKQFDCMPQWSKDEFVCARNINSELIFYENGKFDEIRCKLCVAKISNFSLTPSLSSPYNVAVSIPGAKGQPSHVRIYQYPNFSGQTSAIANKSFYKAERVELYWNNTGNACLILTFSEVSTDSYYGEQQLHYISVKEESCLVPRAKNGPIYNIKWHPNSQEFCIVYGYMPAKATLYNLKCEPTFDFGTGPRNSVYYNPHGNLLCLAGFGSLQGNIEIWDLDKQRLISKFNHNDITYLEWLPDSIHILTATLTPRLRVNNGFRIWNIYGQNIYKKLIDNLFDVQCMPLPLALFPMPEIRISSQHLAQISSPPPVAAYVPPALRNQPELKLLKPKYREEYEPPSNLKQIDLEKGAPSKNAEKNRKKKKVPTATLR